MSVITSVEPAATTSDRGLLRRLVAFPDPVDERSARLVAGGVVIMGIAAMVTDWTWLTVVLAYGFLARVATGPTLSPLGQLVTRVVTPRLGGAPRPVPGPPKRFAQGMGAAFTLTIMVLTLTGHGVGARVVIGLLLVAAILESVFAYCMGCKVFALLMRAGVIPETVCERCNDIWAEDRAAA
jgi:hypothetical protein